MSQAPAPKGDWTAIGTTEWFHADDLEALRELYLPLRRFAAVVGRWDVDPDDLVQETFTRVLVSLSRRPWRVRDLNAYCRRAVVNLASNERRRVRRGAAAYSRFAGLSDGAQTAPSDLADLLRIEPISRGLLFLVEVEGYEIREAALLVGCSEAAARMRLSRARRRLRQLMEDDR